jgi:hypothetical protein
MHDQPSPGYGSFGRYCDPREQVIAGLEFAAGIIARVDQFKPFDPSGAVRCSLVDGAAKL